MFSGLFVGSICISRLGDIVGRKKVLAVCVLVSSIALIIINLTTNLNVLLSFIFIFGLTAAPRYSLSYVYALEIVSTDHESFYAMLSMIIDSLAMIIFGIYFYYVKDIAPLIWALIAV